MNDSIEHKPRMPVVSVSRPSAYRVSVSFGPGDRPIMRITMPHQTGASEAAPSPQLGDWPTTSRDKRGLL